MTQPFLDREASNSCKKHRALELYGLIGLVVLGFMFWGARSLWDSSEARYGQVAFEMLRSGNWLVPTLAGEAHLTKPPFAYWMAAAGMKLFGINAWGARFFLAFFFTGTLFCLRELARTMGYDRKTALSAAFIFATAIVPFIGGHTLTTDAFLTFWETLGILAAWKVWQQPAQRPDAWRLVFWGAFGMGFFTKGPPALLPLIAVGIFLWMRRGRGRGGALVSLPGIVLFLGLSAWWFVVLIVRDPNLLNYFIGDEVIGRIATNVHERNAPFWIYAPVILLGVGPWLLLWPRLAARVYGRFRQKNLLADDRHLFLLLWFAIPLVIFLVAKSRMPLYVMPLFAPLSIVMAAIWCTDVYPRLRPSALKWRAAVAGLIVWCLALTAFTVYPDRLPGARSYRPTAKLFTKTLSQVKEPHRLYWAFASNEKYSIPFYMQRVVAIAKRANRQTADHARQEAGKKTRILFITRARLLPWYMKKSDPPVVLAKDRNFALIEWPQTDSAPKVMSAPGHMSGSGAAAYNPRRVPAFHAANLLLMLAGSHR